MVNPHECPACRGTGAVVLAGDITRVICRECDGTGIMSGCSRDGYTQGLQEKQHEPL